MACKSKSSKESAAADGTAADPDLFSTLSFKTLVAANRMMPAFAEGPGQVYDLPITGWHCMMAMAAQPGSSGGR